jgi:hypothetical protein
MKEHDSSSSGSSQKRKGHRNGDETMQYLLSALYGTANPLIRVVLAWAKFLFANSVSLVFHIYD